MHLLKFLIPTLNMRKQPTRLVLKTHRIKQRKHLTICLTMIGPDCRLLSGVFLRTQVTILRHRLYTDLQIHVQQLFPVYSICTNCMPILCFTDMLLRYIISSH